MQATEKMQQLDRIRRHKMLTKAIERRFAQIGDQSDAEDPIVVAKWFDPCSRWTWYGVELDPETGVAFGFCRSGLDERFDELGYFSVVELGETVNARRIPLERDCYFSECKLSEIRSGARS